MDRVVKDAHIPKSIDLLLPRKYAIASTVVLLKEINKAGIGFKFSTWPNSIPKIIRNASLTARKFNGFIL